MDVINLTRDEFIVRRDELFDHYGRHYPNLGAPQLRQLVSDAMRVLGFQLDPKERERNHNAHRDERAFAHARDALQSTSHWRPARLPVMAIRDMETDHIENTMKWLVQKSWQMKNWNRAIVELGGREGRWAYTVKRTPIYKALRQERIKRFAQQLDSDVMPSVTTRDVGKMITDVYAPTIREQLKEVPIAFRGLSPRTAPGYPHR